MSNWSFIEKIYLYDGTFQGLLTIVFDCFTYHQLPISIFPQKDYLPNFLDNTFIVKTDERKSECVFQRIYHQISYSVLYDCYYAFLSNTPKKELAILKYILHGFEVGPSIHSMLAIDYVFLVQTSRRKMLGESHRFKGLLRFIETDNHLFYASIHPDNNVLEDLGQHFMKRLPHQDFVIHDKIRNLAFFYHSSHYQIIEVEDSFSVPTISPQEKEYQKLWQLFFQTIAIKERTNPRLQMQYMPKKYWQDLVEFSS